MLLSQCGKEPSGSADKNHAHSEKEGHSKSADSDEENHAHSEKESHSEDEHEHGGGEFGPKKGVREYQEQKGIVLGQEALKRFGVSFTPLSALPRKGNRWSLPASALILEENDSGVYVKQGKWLRFVHVRVYKKSPRRVDVEARLSGEAVITKAAPLVRLAELNAAGASGEGHGH